MGKTHFRLTLDPPYSFAIEPGYTHTRHCHDFRLTPWTSTEGAYRDPLTGLVMLKPSYLSDDWYSGAAAWWQLSDWELNADFWAEMNRTSDLTGNKFLSTQDPGTSGGLISGFTAYDIAQISLASLLLDDELVWVAQSKLPLSADEGFVFHYTTLGDDFARAKNWFSLQWADIQIHFSLDGTVRCYRHLDGLPDAPTIFDQFEIARPGELVNKTGYFVFIPIPGYGLAVYHSTSATRMPNRVSSAQSGVTRGHLIALPTTETELGPQLLASSLVTLGQARSLRRLHQIFGFHRIRYPSTAKFTDDIFDPGYTPTTEPDADAGYVPTVAHLSGSTTITTEVLKPNAPATLYSLGDRQGRVRYTLNTSNSVYTPFLYTGNIAFDTVFSTRDTDPIALCHEGNIDLPDTLWRLEFADDENGRFEGSAQIFAKSDALRKVIERGDMTFLLEESTDGGETWETHAGGIARVVGDIRVILTEAGCSYIASINMADMFARFGEITQVSQPAYDGQTLKDAIDNVLFQGTQPLLTSYPAELETITLPKLPKGANFRFAPQIGEHGTDILHDILLLARKQNKEYRVVHDWTANEWTAEAKPRDTSEDNTWTLTPWLDEVPEPTEEEESPKWAVIGDGVEAGRFSVLPPEANLFQAFGLTSVQPDEAERVTGTPLLNVKSISTPTHYDYLGRVAQACPMFAGLSDVTLINEMSRRVYDAAAGRVVQGVVSMRSYVADLKPLARVTIRTQNEAKERIDWDIRTPDTARPPKVDGSPEELIGFWVKRRSVVIDYNGGAGEQAPVVNLHLSTKWEGDIK